jgi:PKHD-type hydroxylase
MNKFGLEEQEINKDLLTYYWWKGGFSEEDCGRALSVCRKYEREEATVFGNDERSDGKIRKSAVRWIPDEKETHWIFKRLSEFATEANNELFKADISGFTESIQFTEYEGKGTHYDWHPDLGPGKHKRKLSIVVQLNGAYEGGELLINNGQMVTTEKGIGNVTIFPSFLLHKVNPVVSGNRYTLVSWISGPVWK